VEAAARAGKDIYCEKPMAKDLEGLKSASDAVRHSGVVFQAGTQLRSTPAFTGCRELYRKGKLGRASRIEQRRNVSRPYWYMYLRDARAEDVDWKEFLMDCPMRPFDAVQFTGWYGFREFSDGMVPGYATHFTDLVNYITGSSFPTSVVAHGGLLTWRDKYGFTCPDQVDVTWVYPEGFVAGYSTNFGNGSGSVLALYGDRGRMDMTVWNRPTFSGSGAFETDLAEDEEPVTPVPMPDHFSNWLQCVRTRETTHAPIDAGYQHAVAVIMAMRAFDTGQRQIYDVQRREIRAG
jgi:predicted dehydrogenase